MKIIIVILTFIILFTLTSCFHRKPSPLEEYERKIEQLQEAERGKTGLPYNFEGPNLNSERGITPEE